MNVTNDAWFGRTAEPYLHLALAAMRAVETRRTLIRSTNTGVSAIIDPVGRVTHETDLTNPETVLADVPLMKGRTPFARVGEIFADVNMALVGAWLAVSLVMRRRRARRG